MCRAQWGYHPGGWGKPPMDTFLREPEQVNKIDPVRALLLNPIETGVWGELLPEEEIESVFIDEPVAEERILDEEEAEHFIASNQTVQPVYQSERRSRFDIDDSEPKVIELRKARRH